MISYKFEYSEMLRNTRFKEFCSANYFCRLRLKLRIRIIFRLEKLQDSVLARVINFKPHIIHYMNQYIISIIADAHVRQTRQIKSVGIQHAYAEHTRECATKTYDTRHIFLKHWAQTQNLYSWALHFCYTQNIHDALIDYRNSISRTKFVWAMQKTSNRHVAVV